MKEHFRNDDTLVVSDIERLGRNADDVIVEIKDLQSRGIRAVTLDVPFLNDWEKMNDDSLSKMIIDIFVTLKAHIAQQEKEKIHDRVTLVADFPDTYKLTGQDEISKTYSFPKSYVSYRKPRIVSTEQRERTRQMMIELNKEKED